MKSGKDASKVRAKIPEAEPIGTNIFAKLEKVLSTGEGADRGLETVSKKGQAL